MRDVGLNLCDFFPKLFEFFRIFGDGVSWRSTACSILPLPFTSFTGLKSRTLPCCFLLLVFVSVLAFSFTPFWLLQLWDRTCPVARPPID